MNWILFLSNCSISSPISIRLIPNPNSPIIAPLLYLSVLFLPLVVHQFGIRVTRFYFPKQNHNLSLFYFFKRYFYFLSLKKKDMHKKTIPKIVKLPKPYKSSYPSATRNHKWHWLSSLLKSNPTTEPRTSTASHTTNTVPLAAILTQNKSRITHKIHQHLPHNQPFPSPLQVHLSPKVAGYPFQPFYSPHRHQNLLWHHDQFCPSLSTTFSSHQASLQHTGTTVDTLSPLSFQYHLDFHRPSTLSEVNILHQSTPI